MKTQYEIGIINYELFKSESLLQVLNNLEKLDQITEDVFERINRSLLENNTKIDNLKNRISRANQIISSLENLPLALTIKSRRNYQLNEDETLIPNSLPKSIFYDDVCDFNLVRNKTWTRKYNEINTKPYNEESKIGKKPNGSLEDITLTQEILNSRTNFIEIKSDLTLNKYGNLFKKNEISEDVTYLGSLHSFTDKQRVFGEKPNYVSTYEPRDSTIVNSFTGNKARLKSEKKIQEGPTTLSDKVKMTRFKQKKELIRRNTKNNLQLNIPMNLNLPLISDFDVQTNNVEDYYEEEKTEDIYAPQGTIYGDDINEFQMPLDIIKNYKAKQSIFVNTTKVEDLNNNQTNSQTIDQTNNTQNISNTNINKSNITNDNKQTINIQSNNNQTINNQTTITQQQNQNINQSQQNVIPNPINNNNVDNQLKNIPPVINQPSTGKIPIPPKIPKAPPMAPSIIKKPISQPEAKIQVNTTKALTIHEEIGDNPRARLKKMTLTPAPQNELKKPAQASMLDLLRSEIGLRFQNLTKNDKPVKKKKKKKEESDSFSSDSESN